MSIKNIKIVSFYALRLQNCRDIIKMASKNSLIAKSKVVREYIYSCLPKWIQELTI